MTLEARGTSAEQQFQVRGDPDLPVTDGQYRTRERYMIALAEVQAQLSGGDVPNDVAQRIRQQMRALAVAGRGFRGGSFFGPTLQQKELLAAIQSELAGH